MPGDPEWNLYNPAGFMAYHQSIGSSARGALDEWRSIGGTAGNEFWNKLYSEIGDTIARTPDFLALDPGAIPSDKELGTWTMGRGGQYATQVIVLQTDRDTGLTSQSYYTVVRDEPHSKQDAEDEAYNDFGSDENQNKYNLTLVGTFALHGWVTEPWIR